MKRKSKDLVLVIAALSKLLQENERDLEGISVDRSTIERAKKVFEKMNRGQNVAPHQLYWAVRVVAESVYERNI